jgi:dephospho-CoA kinase
MKKVIIVTGGIASGKSFILEVMDQLRYPTMKSDKVAKKIMAESFFIDEIRSILGKESFNLKEEIEKDPRVLDLIENLVYPKIEPIRRRFIEEAHSKNLVPVIEIPLFFEKNIKDKLQSYNLKSIALVCGIDVQISRAKDREKPISYNLLNLIISRQLSDKERVARSNFVIYTNFEKSVVKKQLMEILKDI